MKKLPYGIFTGICAMLVFFLTLAFIGLYIVFAAIANQTHSDFSMFQNWWQILIFIVDILSIGGFIYFLIMFIKRERNKNNENI